MKCMDTEDSGVHAYDRQTLLQYSNHATTNLHDVLKKLCYIGLLRRPGLSPRHRLMPVAGREDIANGARGSGSAKNGAGDTAALRTARAKLSRAIREAKRIHGHFQDSRDSRRMWQGIQVITNYKTTPSACGSDASLPDALNDFYARFEAQNNVAARKTIPPPND
ncbi:hypothetical protein QTP86_005389 [Hemibagrus guttatus]|nr:hypothetical protein QTP86_005389 [Hemibagrus guttatus]